VICPACNSTGPSGPPGPTGPSGSVPQFNGLSIESGTIYTTGATSLTSGPSFNIFPTVTGSYPLTVTMSGGWTGTDPSAAIAYAAIQVDGNNIIGSESIPSEGVTAGVFIWNITMTSLIPVVGNTVNNIDILLATGSTGNQILSVDRINYPLQQHLDAIITYL